MYQNPKVKQTLNHRHSKMACVPCAEANDPTEYKKRNLCIGLGVFTPADKYNYRSRIHFFEKSETRE